MIQVSEAATISDNPPVTSLHLRGNCDSFSSVRHTQFDSFQPFNSIDFNSSQVVAGNFHLGDIVSIVHGK